MKKNKLLGIVIVLLAAVCLWWLLSDSPSAMEDTNGPDDYSLQTITEQDILQRELGMSGGISVTDDLLGDGVTISSDGFSGVYDVLYDNYIAPSDFYLQLTNLTVTGGNFRALIVQDDRIVAELPFNSEDSLFIDYLLEDVTGPVYLRLAGESASFRFGMTRVDYDSFSHP